MTEYQIGDLARASGVTARNIRAYRERGLLDPPVRRGRNAWYDDHHLTQLEMINQLLAKGFTSVHIAEFFDGIRAGRDLSEVLGVRDATAAVWRHSTADRSPGADTDVTIDALSTVTQRLVRHGLAQHVNGRVAVTDPALANAVRAAEDPEFYLRVVAEVLDSTHHLIDGLAAQTAAAVKAGSQFRPGLRRAEDLAKRMVAGRLREALEEHLGAPQARPMEAGGF